jgi:hypothetical protein
MMMSIMTIAINGPETGKENEIVKTSVHKVGLSITGDLESRSSDTRVISFFHCRK